MKQVVQKIEGKIRRLWAWVIKGTDTRPETKGQEEPSGPHQFGDAGWQCPECSKWMHEGVKEDHQESHEDNESEDKSVSRTAIHETENKVSKADLLDGDYEIDWETEDEDDGIEIQEVNDNTGLKEKKLRKRWNPVIRELRETGEVTFRQQDHYRAWRGKNIAQEFRKAVKRIDLEMELEFDVERKKSVIRVDGC